MMINRRNFLKVLGVTIVAPATLLATKPKSKPKPGWYDFKPFPTEADREKYRYGIGKRSENIYIYIYGDHYIMRNRRTAGFIITKDKSVTWGVACSDYRKGSKLYAKGTPDCLPWGIFGGVVCVECITPIKKGQTLVWYPDGTVGG